jgi:GNAT superfamily N-acetyltransferase
VVGANPVVLRTLTWYHREVELTKVVDEAGLADWQSVVAASLAADFVALPAPSVADSRVLLSGPVGGEQTDLWIAVVGGEPAVAALTRCPLRDNLTLANVALDVHPDHRRRGYGRAAAGALLDIVRGLGRSLVLCEVASATKTATPAPGEALARSLGARPVHAETRRLLDLDAISDSDLAELRLASVAASAGYSLVAWGDRTPDEYVSDMAELQALMSTDPPQGELDLEPEKWDADRYLEREQSIIDRGRIHLSVGAVEDSTGKLIGFSDLALGKGDLPIGFQWSTIVRGEHRGHRLGMRLKLANLDELRRQQPDVRYLNTWNADENTYMVGVNERLGYRPMETWTEWQLDLAPAASD